MGRYECHHGVLKNIVVCFQSLLSGIVIKINCKNSSEAKISTQPPVNQKEVINNPGKLEK